MRGADPCTEGLFTLKKVDDFVPGKHPLRAIRVIVNKALSEIGELFAQMYEDDIKGGRPSIAPEKLLRAMLLQVLYSIRSERQLMEQTQYNLLFRWFIGLSMDDLVWVPTVFTKNRGRLIEHDAVLVIFNDVLNQADKRKWLSKEHFSVDGTQIQAWRATRASCARMARTTKMAAISEASHAATRPTNPAPIPTAGCFAKARQAASCA
jgi:transposase